MTISGTEIFVVGFILGMAGSIIGLWAWKMR